MELKAGNTISDDQHYRDHEEKKKNAILKRYNGVEDRWFSCRIIVIMSMR